MSMSDDIMGTDPSNSTAYLAKDIVTTLAPGTIIQGRYEVNGVLGTGGMGAVYRVRNLRFKEVVKWHALKEMILKFPDNLDPQTRMRNFEREANILASLDHPLIPKVWDFFIEGARAYLVLDYIEGKNLEDVLLEANGFLDEQVVAGWAIQICQVLEYLHAQQPYPIIFRDLKPANVMLNQQYQPMLIDFGIAKRIQPERHDTMIGTEGYSPPEQYKGQVEPRSDIYALGAMLHQLLTGSDPRMEAPFTFQERPPCRLNPNLSPEMEMIIMKCLAYNIEERWQSARELKKALESMLSRFSLTGELLRGVAPRQHVPTSPQQSENGHRTGFLGAAPAAVARGTTSFPEVAGPRYSPAAQPLSHASGEGAGIAAAATAPTSAVPQPPGAPSINYSQANAPVSSPAMLWRFKTEEEVRASPALANNILYIGSYDYNLYALDVQTGAMKWKFATQAGICGTPACIGDLVITGSQDQQVYAIHGQTGKEIWAYHTGGPVRSSPRIIHDQVVVGSDDTYAYALDLRTGRQLWKHKTWREVRSSAAYAQGLIYIGSDDERVYALEATTGREKWKYPTQYHVTSAPAVGEGFVFAGSTDGYLYALDMNIGWPAWRQYTGDRIFAAPAVSEGRVYIGSVNHYFFCFDAKIGRPLWKYQAGGQITSSAAVVAGHVYFGCSDGAVYCLETRSGHLRWKFQTAAPIASSPLVWDGILYIGSNDGYVYALRCEL
jgi:outer membrane protein assembly factor BamB/serine/threonine protein kinase